MEGNKSQPDLLLAQKERVIALKNCGAMTQAQSEVVLDIVANKVKDSGSYNSGWKIVRERRGFYEMED